MTDAESPALLLGSPSLTPNHPLLTTYSVLFHISELQCNQWKEITYNYLDIKKLSADYKPIENTELKTMSLDTGCNLNFKY